jgi:hypothetical protein
MTTRGVYAEGKVREWLKQHKGERTEFTFNRILDAKSSKGAMSAPQPGDFQWFLDTGINVTPYGVPDGAWPQDYAKHFTRNGLIEVKEVAHSYLLPHRNFGVDQVGRMRIRHMAGSETLIVVCFRPEGLPTHWRSAPLDFFEQRIGGSWNFSAFPSYSKVDSILKEYLK